MASDPWLVPVTALRRAVGTRRRETRSGPVRELVVADSRIPGGTPATVVATLDSVDGGIEVTGVVTARWSGECRRCLAPLGGELRCEVREMYRRRPEGEPPDEDEETYPLSGEQLDLAPLVNDALLLELPMAPLCRDDCAGLCAICGADLNEAPCGCTRVVGDARWEALDALRGAAASEGGHAEARGSA